MKIEIHRSMRALLNIIAEAPKWATTISTAAWSGDNAIEVFKNPSRTDLAKLGAGGMIRALIGTNGDLLYFNDGHLHSELEGHLDVERPHLIFDHMGAMSWNEIEAYRLDEEEPNFDDIQQYYSTKLADDWAMLKANPNVVRIVGKNFTALGIDEHQEFEIDDEWIAKYATGKRNFE